MPESVYIGLDLGQSNDFTAISLLERETVRVGFDHALWEPVTETRLLLRHIERIPLKTPYDQIVRYLRSFVTRPAFEDRKIYLVVDASGIGRPVYDLILANHMPVTPYPVVITGGDRVTYAYPFYNVPRKELLTNLRILLETRKLHITRRAPESEALLHELTTFRSRANTGHDDLVFATALAAWKAASPAPIIYEQTRPHGQS